MNLESIDLEMALSNSLDGKFHVGTKTSNRNKFESSGRDKREKGKDLKAEKSRETITKLLEEQRQDKRWRVCVEPSAEETWVDKSSRF